MILAVLLHVVPTLSVPIEEELDLVSAFQTTLEIHMQDADQSV